MVEPLHADPRNQPQTAEPITPLGDLEVVQIEPSEVGRLEEIAPVSKAPGPQFSH
jgi:hypothetical protein